jgi:hypothetical protein
MSNEQEIIRVGKADMRPQFDRMGQLYAALAKAGLYFKPEALALYKAQRHRLCGKPRLLAVSDGKYGNKKGILGVQA